MSVFSWMVFPILWGRLRHISCWSLFMKVITKRLLFWSMFWLIYDQYNASVHEHLNKSRISTYLWLISSHSPTYTRWLTWTGNNQTTLQLLSHSNPSRTTLFPRTKHHTRGKSKVGISFTCHSINCGTSNNGGWTMMRALQEKCSLASACWR